MAASTSRTDRVYHQDYIARIRYTNTLPPPPNPPKLLNIPNTGLESGHYTSAEFGERLAREHPLNIEADAELGMPIDLIGLPGVFDGRASSTQGQDPPPLPHPQDRPLLRSLATLGKATMSSNVSFLRRTDYISAADQGRSRQDALSTKDAARNNGDVKKRKRLEGSRNDDPARLLRTIIKGFDLAYPHDVRQSSGSAESGAADISSEEKTAWNNPRHPAKAKLTLLDSYPVLPDLDAFPDPGSYLVMKFITNPVTASDVYDTRLDVGLLRPLELPPDYLAETEAQRAACEADPSLPRPGPPQYNYEFFLPQDKQLVPSIKTMLDVNDAHNQDSSPHRAESAEAEKRFFRYERVRAYETYQQSADAEDLFGDAVALSLHDASTSSGDSTNNRRQKAQTAAYVYPIVQRTFIRPRRSTHSTQPANRVEDAKVDFLEVSIREPDETERMQRAGYRTKCEDGSSDQP